MTTITSNKTNELWYAKTGSPTDKTSQTDDQRIKDINVLPPPEHLNSSKSQTPSRNRK